MGRDTCSFVLRLCICAVLDCLAAHVPPALFFGPEPELKTGRPVRLICTGLLRALSESIIMVAVPWGTPAGPAVPEVLPVAAGWHRYPALKPLGPSTLHKWRRYPNKGEVRSSLHFFFPSFFMKPLLLCLWDSFPIGEDLDF
jgi:hypothetical protein